VAESPEAALRLGRALLAAAEPGPRIAVGHPSAGPIWEHLGCRVEPFDVRMSRGAPVPAEVDWALGTLARWRRARAAGDAAEFRDDACRDYAEVARLWSGGNATARARADSARAARRALSCGSA